LRLRVAGGCADAVDVIENPVSHPVLDEVIARLHDTANPVVVGIDDEEGSIVREGAAPGGVKPSGVAPPIEVAGKASVPEEPRDRADVDVDRRGGDAGRRV
jgi:hypothetical protein